MEEARGAELSRESSIDVIELTGGHNPQATGRTDSTSRRIDLDSVACPPVFILRCPVFKILVTTYISDTGISSKTSAVHTLVVEFASESEAVRAVKTINADYSSTVKQKAIILF